MSAEYENPGRERDDYRIPDEPEPVGDEGESIAWMADPDTHLSDVEPPEPPAVRPYNEPLPICDYTTESEEPCEDPAQERRWSSAAVITSAALGALVGALLIAAVLIWALGLIPGTRPLLSVGTSSTSSSSRAPKVTITPGAASSDVSEAVAQKVVPSVVNVLVRQTAINPFTGERMQQDSGNGSGVIIRSDGYILTNNHVIDGADSVIVSVGVEDKKARVVGADPSSDLAVIKIEGSGFPAIDIGNSKDLKVGQYVMAVGSPFGFERSATVGIVSALNRSELIQGRNDITTYTNLIQTDAAINPGNSGGALVDEQGRLVGINTLIQSTSGSSAGIGFAIPVDFAMDIADQLIKTGKASHPYIGVSTETVTESVAREFGLPVDKGALVRFVQPNSPSADAGIERGDIIVRIGDDEISGVEDVFAAVRKRQVGDKVPIEVVRNDARRTFTVTLGSDADRR